MTSYIFDTNCLISAHLSPVSSLPRLAYNKALKQGILLYSEETLQEFKDVFSRPKFDRYIPIEERMKAVALYERIGLIAGVFIKVNACRDPKDNKFLELALSSEAKIIITGDKDLLDLHPFQGITIISPAEFVNNF